MIKPFSIFFVVLLLALPCFAQASKPNRASGDQTELMQLERDIGQANVRRNKAFFERIEADEFIFTDSAGGITTKAEDIASLDKPAGEYKLISYDVDEMKVSMYDKTAVVTGRTTTTLQSPQRMIVNRNRFTDVFVKRGGRWQMVAGHSSRIREPQK